MCRLNNTSAFCIVIYSDWGGGGDDDDETQMLKSLIFVYTPVLLPHPSQSVPVSVYTLHSTHLPLTAQFLPVSSC